MWTRLFSPALPTPLHSEDVGPKNKRKYLLGEGEDDTHSPLQPPKKRVSIHPIFDKYKRHTSNDDDLSINHFRGRGHNLVSSSPAPEPSIIETLKRNYAALRVTLHSQGVKDVAMAKETLVTEAEDRIRANLSKLNKIDAKMRQLCASSLDCEVDTQISSNNGQQRTITVQIKNVLSKYQDAEAKRSKQLAQLWDTWEVAQTGIEELSNKLHEFFERVPLNGTSGMSSLNCEWSDQEDLDIGRRSKQVVEDMASCEEEFQEKLKDEETNILEVMLKYSLG
ncbi:hypothetical protein GGS21DRAFT_400490 [Xylaria nigripes]|nr:hypothetical protein GGS21DRAFT_400490 [Xylaria nigripes]